MQRHDYFWGIIAGFATSLFIFPILNNLRATLPFPDFLLIFAMPVAWAIALWIASFLAHIRVWMYQLVKFGIVGLLNTAIDFGILNFGSALTGIYSGTGIITINIISFSVAVINSYFWNRLWVFDKSGRIHFKEFLQFLVVSFIAIVINSAIVFGITTFAPFGGVTPAVLENIAKIIATVVSLVWNFLGYKFFVFKT